MNLDAIGTADPSAHPLALASATLRFINFQEMAFLLLYTHLSTLTIDIAALSVIATVRVEISTWTRSPLSESSTIPLTIVFAMPASVTTEATALSIMEKTPVLALSHNAPLTAIKVDGMMEAIARRIRTK